MSYDIYFFDGEAHAITRATYFDYFRGRQNWSVDEQAAQAVYEHEDTGVYFVSDFSLKREDEGDNDDIDYPCISFNINYFRPPIFGLEAAIELEVFQERFAARFHDPQNDGMGTGRAENYSSDGFLKGYDAGNRFGYGAIGKRLREEGDAAPTAAAEAAIEQAWRWNYYGKANLRRRFESSNVDVFVAGAFWATFPDESLRPLRIAVWTDGIRAAIPEFVDAVILYGEEIHKSNSVLSRLFGGGRKTTMTKATVSDLKNLACAKSEMINDIPYLFIDSHADHPPQEVQSLFLENRPPLSESFQIIATDQILSAELLSEATKTEDA